MNAYYGQSGFSACAPIDSCCECATMTIPPGVRWPIRVDWSPFIQSVGGYSLNQVLFAGIEDLQNPGHPAKATDIEMVSGYEDDVKETTPGWTHIIEDGTITETLVQTGPVPVGSRYRLNLGIKLIDCAGRAISEMACIWINIQKC